ncbi:MAG: hypothetical protein II704_01415 [Erysipelotrichaceae bacterium]|nr:hypothetical protein [Erysipelotrichaceae bacterium]
MIWLYKRGNNDDKTDYFYDENKKLLYKVNDKEYGRKVDLLPLAAMYVYFMFYQYYRKKLPVDKKVLIFAVVFAVLTVAVAAMCLISRKAVEKENRRITDDLKGEPISEEELKRYLLDGDDIRRDINWLTLSCPIIMLAFAFSYFTYSSLTSLFIFGVVYVIAVPMLVRYDVIGYVRLQKRVLGYYLAPLTGKKH